MPQMAITCTPRSCITRCGAVCILAVALIAAAVNLAGQAPAYSSAEWGAPGGDWASTRYSTLTRINTTNVGQLGGAWVVELPDRQVSKAPLMVKDGRMFVPTSQGTILALDPGTGQTIWTYKPETPFSGNRGVGIGEGLLFAGLRNSNVLAISQETGQVAWTYEHGPEIPSQGMSSAPAYGNGVVVAVVSLGDNFLRGRAIGLDAKTGKFLWKLRGRARARRTRARDLAAGQRHLEIRRRSAVDHAVGRRRARARVSRDRQRRAPVGRRASDPATICSTTRSSRST